MKGCIYASAGMGRGRIYLGLRWMRKGGLGSGFWVWGSGLGESVGWLGCTVVSFGFDFRLEVSTKIIKNLQFS